MEQTENKQLEQIYRETFPKVAKLVKQLGGDLSAAKDIFHDALIIYLEKCRVNASHVHTSPQSYIVGIARILWARKFNDELKYAALDDDAELISDFYQDKVNARPLLQQLRYAGERCLQLLQAFYYKQWPAQKIAETLNYGSPHSVSVQKYKCLEKVREQIKQTEIYEEYIA